MTGSLFEYIKRVSGDSNHTALKKGLTGPLLSYQKLFTEVEKVSRFLPSQTVISTVLDNTIECVVCFLAIGLAGSVVAPLNPGSSESEFEFYLRKSPGGVIVPKSGSAHSESAATRLGIPIKYVVCDAEGSIHISPRTGSIGFQPKIIGPETHLMLFTSGTTGEPKSVPLSHSNMIASLQNIVKTYSLGRADVTLAVMPLFHIHGLMASLFATLGSGGTVILPFTGIFSAKSFLAELVGNQCTWFTAVPTMHHILLNTVDGRSVLPSHRLRFIRSCSSALAPALLHQIEAMYGGVDVLEAYAMTEACHQMTSNPIGGGRKPGSVGVAQGTVQIAIFDPSSDIPINEANKRGEVCVKGPNVMKKYLDNDFANKSAFTSSGFFRTGDEGHMDEGGFLTITGRLKEMINKGGEKISPIEIDSALLAHPAVMEAVAFAIPDPKYGEVVGAAVRLRADMMHVSEADLMMFVGTKLASFKVPGGVFIVSELPRTASGKIQRRLIAAQFISKSKL